MDIQSVGWMISAISVGYLICSLARPVIVGRRIHIAIPWLEAYVGEEAVVRCGGKRVVATVVATGGDLLLPDGVVCHLPPEGHPAADIVYGALSEVPGVTEVPIGCICVQYGDAVTIIPLGVRVGAVLI